MTYAEKLKDPRWKALRCELVQKSEGRCANCGASEDGPLEVHHLAYIRGKEPWEYDHRLLKVLCRNCHMNWQINQETMQIALAMLCGQRGLWHSYALSKVFLSHAKLGYDAFKFSQEIEDLLMEEMRK